MLVGVRDRVPHSRRLLEILRLVRLQQRDIAEHLRIRRVHIAEHRRLRRVITLLAALNVNLRPLLFALVAVEYSQRDLDADPKRLVRIRIVSRRVVGVPAAPRRVGRAVRNRQLVVDFRFLNLLQRRLQVRTPCQRKTMKVIQRRQLRRPIEIPGDVEVVHRRPVIQQLQQLDLRRPQVHYRRLLLGLILHPQQLDAVEINLRNVAVLVALLADLDDLVVILEVIVRRLQHRLRLQRLHVSVAQVIDKVALEVQMLRCRDRSVRLGIIQPQVPLVVALPQIRERRLIIRSGKRLPHAITRRNLRPVHQHREAGIRPQERSNFLRPRLFHAQRIGLQLRIHRLKSGLQRIPRHRLLHCLPRNRSLRRRCRLLNGSRRLLRKRTPSAAQK